MKQTYYGHDGIVNAGEFHSWIMTSEGIRNIFYKTNSRLDTNSLYLFRDATIEFFEDGDWKDGSPIEIRVEGDTDKIFEQICKNIELRFPELN